MISRILVSAAAVSALLASVAACSSTPRPSASTVTSSSTSIRSSASPSFLLAATQGLDASGAFDPQFTCDTSTDFSPGFTISHTPSGTAELALSMVDLDNNKIHWLQLGIPATATGLKAHTLITGAHEVLNDLGEATYDGPCPPRGTTHTYQITLYALPSPLPADFGANTPPSQTLHELQSKASAAAQLTATYTRHG